MCDRVCELIQLLHTCEERTTRYGAIEQLGQIGIGREDAIDALTEIVRLTPDEPTRWLAIENLSQIAIGHSTAVDTLIEMLAIGRPPTKELVAKYLPPMLGDNSSAVTALVNIPRTESDETTLRAVAAILGKVGTKKSAAIDALIHLVYKTSDSHTWMRAIDSLTQLKANSNDAIFVYLYLIRNNNYYLQKRAISALKNMVLDGETIEASSKLLRCSSILAGGGFFLCRCWLSLMVMTVKLPQTVFTKTLPIFYNSFQRLDRLISRLSNRQMKCLQKKLRASENFLERYLIARDLGQVGLATSETVDLVLKSLQQEQHRAFRTFGYYSLARMTASNLAIGEKLIDLLSTAKDEDERQSITWALKEAEDLKRDILKI